MAIGPCFMCKKIFSYNSDHVPSIQRRPHHRREPVCASCMAYANEIRGKRGMPPLLVDPEAYHPIEREQ
jgi:hypothetical protein